jgi:hypothetical protein
MNDRSDYDRHYDELKEIQENRSDRLDVGYSKRNSIFSCGQEDESGYDTKAQGDEYLQRQ